MFFTRLPNGMCEFFENYEKQRRKVLKKGQRIVDDAPQYSVPVDKISTDAFSDSSSFPTANLERQTISSWEDYLSTLEDWECDLIDQVEFRSVVEVAEALTNGETTITVASDGGATMGHGSFGWLICYSPEHVVARCKGMVRGYPINSRRAEGYGGLSLASFIFHVLKFFNISFDTNIRWYCDSQDIIKRVREYSSTPWHHFSHKLQGDDDVVIQLHHAWQDIELLREMGHDSTSSPMQIIHVKSHQDDHKKYEKLNDAAKCNYQCDQLATIRLQMMDKTLSPPEIHDLPSAKIYLSLYGQTVTSQEKKQCLEVIPRREFEDYIERKFHWLKDEALEYDWENFGVARRTSRPGMQVFVTKLMFRLLPTAAREKRIGVRTCDACKQCGEVEDITHLFLCYKRSEWLPTLAFAINRFCHEKHITTSVREYFKRLFNEFKRNTPYATKIVMELLCGLVRLRLVEEMGPLNDERDQCVRGLIRIFWEHAFKAWDRRNQFIHGKTSSNNGRERENTISAVKKLFEKSNEMSDARRSIIFPSDMESFLSKSTNLLQDWILRNKQTVEMACQEYLQDSTANTQCLETFFHKKTVEIEERHPLSDDEYDDNDGIEGEFHRMLRVTCLLSCFPRLK